VDKRRKYLRTRLFVGVALLATGLSLIAYAFHFGFFEGLEQQSIDMRFSIRGSEGPPKDVVLVNIDDQTFNDLGVVWPFNRTLHAKVIDRVCAGHPKAIAMDVQFSQPRTAVEDNALGQSIFDCNGKVALATTVVGPDGTPGVIFDAEALRQFHAKAGDSNFTTDSAEVIRKMPYELDGLKSFALDAAELATGKTITRSSMGNSSQWIDFAGPSGTVKTYSYSRVLPLRVVHAGGAKPWKIVAFGAAPKTYVTAASTRAEAEAALDGLQIPPSVFRGKVVVVGASTSVLQEVADIHATSTGPHMPGPEIQANAIETAIKGFPLRGVGTLWDVVLIVCLGSVVPLASLRSRPLVAVATGFLFAAIFIPGVLIASFRSGRIASFVYPLAALILATFGSIAVHYIVTEIGRAHV